MQHRARQRAFAGPPPTRQAFDDCTTLSSIFKLLESFEGLLEREAIAAELTKKQAELVNAFAADVTEVTELFEAGREAPLLSASAPPHAGAVAWVRAMKGRLAEPYGKLAAKEHGALLEGREGRAAAAAYSKIMAAMDAYEGGVVDSWCRQVGLCGRCALLRSIADAGLASTVRFAPRLLSAPPRPSSQRLPRPPRLTTPATRSSTSRCCSSTRKPPQSCPCLRSTLTPRWSRCCGRPSTSCSQG